MNKPDSKKGKAFSSPRPSGYSRRQALGMLGVGSAAILSGYAVHAAHAQTAPVPSRPPRKGGVLRIGQQFDIGPTRVHAITYQH